MLCLVSELKGILAKGPAQSRQSVADRLKIRD